RAQDTAREAEAADDQRVDASLAQVVGDPGAVERSPAWLVANPFLLSEGLQLATQQPLRVESASPRRLEYAHRLASAASAIIEGHKLLADIIRRTDENLIHSCIRDVFGNPLSLVTFRLGYTLLPKRRNHRCANSGGSNSQSRGSLAAHGRHAGPRG